MRHTKLYEDLRRHQGAEEPVEYICRALREGQMKPRELSIRALFESTVEDGTNFVRNWQNNPVDGRTSFLESGVSSTAFSNINKQLLSTEVMEGYTDAPFIGDQLTRNVPTNSPFGERITGLSRIGDEAEAIGEGQPYPLVGFGEDYVQMPDPVKRGMICPITREAIQADRTGQILDRAREIGYWIAYNKELRILNVVTGIVNTYERKTNGVVATYGDNSGTHDWDNLVSSNPLTDWNSIDNVKQNFQGLRDPNTGTPIMVMGNTALIPQALEATAGYIKTASEYEQVDNQANASTLRVKYANPEFARSVNYITSPLMAEVTGSSTTWFMGDFQRAFNYMEIVPVTTVQAPLNSEMEFTSDIMERYKVTEWGVAAVKEPRYVQKSVA